MSSTPSISYYYLDSINPWGDELFVYQLFIYINCSLDCLPKLGLFYSYNNSNNHQPIYDKNWLKLYAKKPSYAGIKAFNDLPLEINQATNLNIFKHKVKHVLTDKVLCWWIFSWFPSSCKFNSLVVNLITCNDYKSCFFYFSVLLITAIVWTVFKMMYWEVFYVTPSMYTCTVVWINTFKIKWNCTNSSVLG